MAARDLPESKKDIYFQVMQTRSTRKPGQKGTKKLVAQYGDKLVCIRYRYDPRKKKRYKTIELIIEEVDWTPQLKPQTMVWVKVEWGEVEVARQIKQAGGIWNKQRKVWELHYDQVIKLDLEKRMVGGA